jgi:branched-chain amino acid transport system substrate-binding protein
MKKNFFLIIILLLIAGIELGCNENNSETIKIGVINPMTGDFAVYGKPVQDGMNLAVDKINSEGGINGKKIQLIFEDDEGNPSKTVNAINKLIKVDKVSIVLGPLSSGTSLAAAPIAEKNKIVQISTLAGTPDLTNSGDYIFRIYPSSILGAKYTAEKAIEMSSPKKVAILYPNNTLGKASALVYAQECKKQNIEVVVTESYNDGDKDFRNQLVKIKQSHSDLILCSAYWGDGANILKQMTELNIMVPVFGEDGWHGELSALVQSSILNKLFFADLLFGAGFNNDIMKKFIADYETKYKKKATTYAATGFDAVYIAKQAIEKNGSNSEKIKDYLYTIDYTGACGHVRFDKNGDNVGVSFGIYQIDSNDNAILIKK